MRVLHIIQSISRSSGGPARSVQGLVAGLNRAGVEAWLLTLRKGEKPWVDGIERFVNGKPFEDALSYVRPHIVHLHGIWDTEIHRCAVICRRWGIKYVIAPRGMLEPWSLQQKWLKKRIARLLYQDRDLKCAVALHATAENEAEQFRRLGFKNPVIISPNGVNVPNIDFDKKQSSLELELQTRTDKPKRALFVSRMHPKKGVLELVEAWNKIRPMDWKCELVYTVSGEFEKEYEAKVKARVNELGLVDQFVFTGALNDDEKWKVYAHADLFVLPTYSENFGIVVAEALWAGVPVITTKGTPWQELEQYYCGWWIDVGVESLENALKAVTALDDTTLRAMGMRGRELIDEKYTWFAAASKMIEGYESVIRR